VNVVIRYCVFLLRRREECDLSRPAFLCVYLSVLFNDSFQTDHLNKSDRYPQIYRLVEHYGCR